MSWALVTCALSVDENPSAGLVKLRWNGAAAVPLTDEVVGAR